MKAKTSPSTAHQRHPTDRNVGLAGQGGPQRVGSVDLMVDEDGLSVQGLLLGPLVRVLEERVEAGLERPRWELSLLEVLVLSVSVRHVTLLLPTLPPAAVAGHEAEHQRRHGASGDGDDEGLQTEQHHAGLYRGVVRLSQTLTAGVVAISVRPVLGGLSPGVGVQLVDDGPEVPLVQAGSPGHEVSSRTGVVVAGGDVLEEGGLAALGPALCPSTLPVPDTPGTVRVLQTDTLQAALGLLTPVQRHRLHLLRRADDHVARALLGAHNSH